MLGSCLASAHCLILTLNLQALPDMAPPPQRAALGGLCLGLLLCCGLHYACGASLPTFVNRSDAIQVAAYIAAAKEAADSTVERAFGCECLPEWEAIPTPAGTGVFRSLGLGFNHMRCCSRRQCASTKAPLE